MKSEYAKLQDRMRQVCASAGIENYFLDGPVTDAYWSARPRIAVLHLEAYEYEKCHEVGLNLDLIRGWMQATGGKIRTKTTRYTSVFVAGLQRSFASNTPVSPADLKKSYHDFDDLLSAMSKISYLNIRKTSNTVSKLDTQSINKFSTGEWLKLLQEQFRILDPEIIIVGGHDGCSAANRVFVLNGGLKYGGFQTLPNGAEVLSVKHFSRVSYTSMASVIEGIIKRKRPPC
jgi:hypothetical protein